MADEHITVKIGQLEPYPREKVNPEDLVYVGDVLSGKLHHANVSQLPSGQGTTVEGNVNYLGSPFLVKSTDTTISTVNGNTIIEDIRLIGKSDYPVHTTQLNISFKDEDLVYDADKGTLTINNFLLNTGERIELYPSGVNSDGNTTNTFNSVLEKLKLYDKILAVFMPSPTNPSGAVVLWERPASEIPIGWEEATEYRGKSIVGHDPFNPTLDTLGGIAGSDNATLTIENLPPHDHYVVLPDIGFDYGKGDSRDSSTRQHDGKTGKAGGDENGQAKPFSLLYSSRIVKYIRFVG